MVLSEAQVNDIKMVLPCLSKIKFPLDKIKNLGGDKEKKIEIIIEKHLNESVELLIKSNYDGIEFTEYKNIYSEKDKKNKYFIFNGKRYIGKKKEVILEWVTR